jgi:hypothetical protein
MGELIDKAKDKAKQMGQAISERVRHAGGVIEEEKGKIKGEFERMKEGTKEEKPPR